MVTNHLPHSKFKILFIGDLNTWTRSYQRYRTMQDLGHEVIGFTTVPIPTQPGLGKKPSLFFRIRNKLGYPVDETGVNQCIGELIAKEEPDIAWVEKGLMIRPATLRMARRSTSDILLAFYSEDDMYMRHNQSAYFKRCLPFYNIVFTTKSYNLNELPEIGARKVVFVDKAYDQALHRPLPVTEGDKQRLGADVIFIGGFEEDRAQQMLYLAKNGIPVRVWGGRWEAWKNRHPNLIVEALPIYEGDYVKALCASKIALCFLRKINRDLQTARTMEIPACGTFMMAERTSEHLRLFEEGREAEYFETKEELLKKVVFYLQNESKRIKIAKAGRERCESSGYSHHDRVEYMLGCINESKLQ